MKYRQQRKREYPMNLPNKLTVARIAMVPLFAVAASMAQSSASRTLYFLAGLIFAAASLTDMLDGKLARKMNLITNFGKFADPLADKILTTAAFLYMQNEGVCSPAVMLLILTREFAVAGLRMIAAAGGDSGVIAANIWGKVKTVLQMASILFFYFGSALLPWSAAVRSLSSVLCWTCALATVLSGVIYFRENRSVLAGK